MSMSDDVMEVDILFSLSSIFWKTRWLRDMPMDSSYLSRFIASLIPLMQWLCSYKSDRLLDIPYVDGRECFLVMLGVL